MSDIGGLEFALCTLAVWRVAHLLSEEDGPFDIVLRIRRKAGQGVLGDLLDCFLCLSLWVAVPFALLVSASWAGRGVAWLALSGAASILYLLPGRSTKTHEEWR